jgi:hypothetical protein
MNANWTPEEMHIYVGLAERESATRKVHCEVLQGKVVRSRQENAALQLRLQEWEGSSPDAGLFGTSFSVVVVTVHS